MRIQTRRRFCKPSILLGFGLLLALLTAGCGDDSGGELEQVTPYPVTGKVLLPSGEPLTEGRITFVPVGENGRQAIGMIQPDGSFTLTTINEGDGAGPGEYQVRIVSTLSKPGPRKTSVAVVPQKYEDESSSGITATVKPEPNTLEPFKINTDKPVLKKTDSERD